MDCSAKKLLTLVVVVLGLFVPLVLNAGELRLRVAAGPHDRTATPVRWQAPEGVDLTDDCELVRVDTGRAVAAQRDGERGLVWLLAEPLAAGEVRVYDVVKKKPLAAVNLADIDDKHLLYTTAGKQVLRYNYGLVEAPPGVDKI